MLIVGSCGPQAALILFVYEITTITIKSFTILNPSILQQLICRSGGHHRLGASYQALHIRQRRNIMMNTSRTTQLTVEESAIKVLRRQKQNLRKQIRHRIKSTYPPTSSATQLLHTASNAVFTQLFNLQQYKDAKSIGFFLSMPSGEIQTRDAIRTIVYKDGKVLYVPRVGLDFEKCDMDLIRCDTSSAATDYYSNDNDDTMFYDSWPRNKWGIPEPPTSNTDAAKAGDIDLLIAPGLSFDTNGHRLGQGKGYYDRFIAKMRGDGDNGDDTVDMTKKKPLLVGVCLEEQFLEEVPHGLDLGDANKDGDGIIPVSDHDYLMDMVITPSMIYDLTK